jgi:hypothetical protein
MLTERIQDNKVVCLLEFYNRVPLLIGWKLFGALLDKATIKPEV